MNCCAVQCVGSDSMPRLYFHLMAYTHIATFNDECAFDAFRVFFSFFGFYFAFFSLCSDLKFYHIMFGLLLSSVRLHHFSLEYFISCLFSFFLHAILFALN